MINKKKSIDKDGDAIILPCFNSVFFCIEGFKAFKRGGEYQIVGFGNSLDANGKKHDSWWVKTLKDNGVTFPVKKGTIAELFSNKVLKNKI